MMTIGIGLMIVMMVGMFVAGSLFVHGEGKQHKEQQQQLMQEKQDQETDWKSPPKFYPMEQKEKEISP